MAVWICQCLCPNRHCILAVAGEAEDRAAAAEIVEQLEAGVNALANDAAMNPWCAICRAPLADWHLELGRTRFASLEEASSALAQSEADQALTCAVWERTKGTLH
jgi:hypothetical protein